VEPDYDVWKEYAYKSGVHAAIMTYLDIKKVDFYKIETTVDGKSFVTARGWSDLSDMIKLYEQHELKVDESLVGQYLQNRKISKDFAVYYDLFNKYKADYQVDKILAGEPVEVIKGRAKAARFDERLSLLGLLLDAVTGELREVCNEENAQKSLLEALKTVRLELARPGSDADEVLNRQIQKRRKDLETGKRAGSLSEDDRYAIDSTIAAMDEERAILLEKQPENGQAAFALLKTDFDKRTKQLKKHADEAGKKLSNMFKFCEDVFRDGQEMVILVTELTISYYGAHFISRYGCKEYFAHNKELLFYERQKEIITELENLEL
jgi:hypothetical protein